MSHSNLVIFGFQKFVLVKLMHLNLEDIVHGRLSNSIPPIFFIWQWYYI